MGLGSQCVIYCFRKIKQRLLAFRGVLFIILLIPFWVENQSLEQNPPIRNLSIFEYPGVTISSVYFQLLDKCLIELTPSSKAYIKRHSFKIIYPLKTQTVDWTLSRTTSCIHKLPSNFHRTSKNGPSSS